MDNNFDKKNMNNSFDEDDYNEDNIRQPDSVKTERLLEDDFYDERPFDYNTNNILDKDMNNAFEESKKDYESRIQLEEEYEKQVIQDYLTIVETNKVKFQPLLNILNRLSKFDKDIKEINDILEPIIDSYCAQALPFVEFDTITYDRIYKVLGSIRTDKNCIEELKKVVICEI
jgi:hypothetical protein